MTCWQNACHCCCQSNSCSLHLLVSHKSIIAQLITEDNVIIPAFVIAGIFWMRGDPTVVMLWNCTKWHRSNELVMTHIRFMHYYSQWSLQSIRLFTYIGIIIFSLDLSPEWFIIILQHAHLEVIIICVESNSLTSDFNLKPDHFALLYCFIILFCLIHSIILYFKLRFSELYMQVQHWD